MFKAGDKVVCVSAPATWDAEELTKGCVYTVKSIREDYPDECFFEECAYSWKMSRFELCKPEQEVFQKGDSLRCVDNEGVTDFLNLGEIYECSMANSYYVWVVGSPSSFRYEHGVGFGHSRFEKVERTPAHLEQSPSHEWDEIAGYRIGQQVLDGLTGKFYQQSDSVQLPEAFAERNKYSREIKPKVFVDVYDVLRAFAVTDPCLQHLAKKALCAGLRGHKDRLEDLEDIKKSIERAIEMHKEWEQQ